MFPSQVEKKFNSYLMAAGVGFSSESINLVDGMKLLKDRREEFWGAHKEM